MTEQRRKEAIEYIESQLKYGYVDLGINDQDELLIIEEAIKTLKIIDKFNSIEIIERNKQVDNGCSGCIYEDVDGSTEDTSNCVCCSRMVDFAKNDNYKKR